MTVDPSSKPSAKEPTPILNVRAFSYGGYALLDEPWVYSDRQHVVS